MNEILGNKSQELISTIQALKNVKEELRRAINARGGSLAEDAKLSDFSSAVDSLTIGSTAVDFGSSYSDYKWAVSAILKEELAFTAEVERGLRSGEYSEEGLKNGTQKVLFNGEQYTFYDKIAFWPSGMNPPNDFYTTCNETIKEYRGSFNCKDTINHFRACYKLVSLGENYNITGDSVSFSFAYCYGLVYLSCDFTNTTAAGNAFYLCYSLTHMDIKGWGMCNLTFTQSERLSPLSVHNIIEAGCKVYDELIAEGKTVKARKLTLSANAKKKWEASEYYASDLENAATHEITIA